MRRGRPRIQKPRKKPVQEGTRRGNNEGSIFQRKSDGLWVGSLTIGYDENGRQKKKLVYAKTRTEVAIKLAQITGRMKNENFEILDKKTFGELMFEWLMVFKKSAVTPRSFEGIFRNFKLHIEPIIGNMKLYEIDTFVVQKVINVMIDKDYCNNTIKKNRHLLSQFFEYAIDNKWVQTNPTLKVKMKVHDRNTSEHTDKYKAMTPEVRTLFLEKLNKDESNFLKPFCIVMMFAGLRVGEAIALKWKDFNPETKTLKVDRAITEVPKFDSNGNVIKRITVVGSTKTLCSVREIPVTDIIVDTLLEWKEKQKKREVENPNVKAELTTLDSFIFANDDGSVRTYSGCRMIFDRFKRRNGLNKYHIHFHGLRHTFSNMLFEMNENPKVIQQLLGHRDVKTTITVYNSVDNEYVRQTTEKFNEKIRQEQLYLNQKRREEELEQQKEKLISGMNDDEFDDMLIELMKERQERKKKKQQDFEM